MENYTLSLALVDFIPVFLSGAGLFYLMKWLKANGADDRVATLGPVLIFLGGFLKACWKLIWVLTATDINILEHALFPLLGSGFILLTVAYLRTINQHWPQRIWTMPLGTIAAILAIAMVLDYTMGGDAPLVMIGVAATTIPTVIFSIRWAHFSFKSDEKVIGILAILFLVGTFGMAGLARATGQTLEQQWMAELTNVATQGMFFIAALLTFRRIKIRKE